MHLVTISGFLGTGKTTLILNIVEAAVARGIRVAILVNEIGEIGIDDQLFGQHDLNVQQLLNGCVCCSLSKDLPRTLEELVEVYDPELAILEPSGAADLIKVLAALRYYRGKPLSSQTRITLLDPLRLEKLKAVVGPLIISQMKGADHLLLTKADLADPSQIDRARQWIRKEMPEIEPIAICARDPLPQEICKELLPWMV
jgi:G3E family GTPase